MENIVDVPGARLRVRSSGSGPVLLLLGGTADGGGLGGLRPLLDDAFTVVTHDRRGLGGSPVDDPSAPVDLACDADDAAAVLAAVTAPTDPTDPTAVTAPTAPAGAPALVAGTSNGAVLGLELALRHPRRVRRLVAHEPPLPALLPEDERRAVVEVQRGIDDRLRAGNADDAAGLLATLTGLPNPGAGSPGAEAARAAFWNRVARPLHRYRPDPDAIAACPVPIVVAAGWDGVGLVGRRSAEELARLRGTPVVDLPGGHGGFVEHPEEFAARLRDILAATGPALDAS